MGFDLSLDGKIIRHLEFPICRMERTDKAGAHRESFHIAGGHTFQGEYRTKSAENIRVDIWQAGADPGDLILGVSFTTEEQVLLNTVHIVSFDENSHFELDPGLVSRSYPLKAASAAAH